MGFWNILFAVPPLAPPEAGMAAEAFRSSVCVLDLPFGRSPRSFRTQFGTPPTRLQDPLEQPTTPSRARWVGHRENSEAVCHGTRPAIGGPRSNGEEIRRPPPTNGTPRTSSRGWAISNPRNSLSTFHRGTNISLRDASVRSPTAGAREALRDLDGSRASPHNRLCINSKGAQAGLPAEYNSRQTVPGGSYPAPANSQDFRSLCVLMHGPTPRASESMSKQCGVLL